MTDLTIFIRPPLAEKVDEPDLLKRAETLNLLGVEPPLPLKRIGPGRFQGPVPPGTYEVVVDTLFGRWQVPRWRVRVRGDRQRIQLFMGQSDWPACPIGDSLVPFRPPDVVAVVFETAPPTARSSAALIPALVERFGFTSAKDALAAFRVGDKFVPPARGSILLMGGQLTAHEPAEIERFVAEFLGRDPTLAPPRVGVAVDLRPGCVKILDRRFVLRHDRGRMEARASAEQNGARWLRDLDSADGTVLCELTGGDHLRHLEVLEELRRNDDVVCVEPDLMSEIQDADDPLFSLHLERIPEAWGFLDGRGLPELGSRQVTIAIFDRDIPYSSRAGKVDHLQAPRDQVVGFLNFNDQSEPDDGDLHGLKVYGIVAAETDGVGAEGIAPGTSILVVERCSVNSVFYNDILLWLSGLKEAVPGLPGASERNPHPADVICCAHVSGAPRTIPFSDTIRRIITEGRIVNGEPKGAFVVYAAGNDSGDVSEKNGFADDANTIAVANCKFHVLAGGEEFDPEKFSHVSSSNFGTAIDLCALGHQAYTILPGGDGQWQGGGTSAACAVVAGAIGLLLSAFPGETHSQIRERLRLGAEQIDPNQQDLHGKWQDGHSGYYGNGLLNLRRSMEVNQ